MIGYGGDSDLEGGFRSGLRPLHSQSGGEAREVSVIKTLSQSSLKNLEKFISFVKNNNNKHNNHKKKAIKTFP